MQIKHDSNNDCLQYYFLCSVTYSIQPQGQSDWAAEVFSPPPSSPLSLLDAFISQRVKKEEFLYQFSILLFHTWPLINFWSLRFRVGKMALQRLMRAFLTLIQKRFSYSLTFCYGAFVFSFSIPFQHLPSLLCPLTIFWSSDLKLHPCTAEAHYEELSTFMPRCFK